MFILYYVSAVHLDRSPGPSLPGFIGRGDNCAILRAHSQTFSKRFLGSYIGLSKPEDKKIFARYFFDVLVFYNLALYIWHSDPARFHIVFTWIMFLKQFNSLSSGPVSVIPVSLQKSIFPEKFWLRGGSFRLVHRGKV